MKINLSKKQKKWALIALISLGAYWLYRRFYTVTVNVNAAARTAIAIVQNLKSYVDKGRRYVTLLFLPKMDWDSYFTELQNIGIDGVFPNVRFADIVKADGTYDFSTYDRLFAVATSKNIEVFPNLVFRMGVGEWSRYGFAPSERWLNSDGSLYGTGSVSAKYDSTIWTTHFAPFVTAFCQRYKDYHTKGWMLGVSFANTIQDEFNFSNELEPDFAPTYKQKHTLLENCFNLLTTAAGDIPTCYHSGEFQTGIAFKVGSLGFRRIGQRAGWFKQNPNKNMDTDYYARATASPGKGSIVELTYTEGETEYELSTQASRCFALGVDIVTFSFVEDAEGLPKVRAINNQLVQKGITKGALPSHEYTILLSDMLANQGYKLADFKAAYVGGVPPKVNQIYNL